MAHSPNVRRYTKPHASGLDRVKHLRQLGLIIPRPNVAAQKIDAIGYERLRIYLLSRRDSEKAGKPFFPNTSYRDILKIYECDARLRDICFVAVGQFELHVRNSISEKLSTAYGSHPYGIKAAFKNEASRRSTVQTFSSIYLSSKDRRARHYEENYDYPFLPPIWRMKEFLTFGKIPFFYKALSNPIRKEVALDFGVDDIEIFSSWMSCLVDLRNICAHHDRLFNRSMQKQPTRYKKVDVPKAITPKKKLKAPLECLDFMMEKRGTPVSSVASARKVISKYPMVHMSEAGY